MSSAAGDGDPDKLAFVESMATVSDNSFHPVLYGIAFLYFVAFLLVSAQVWRLNTAQQLQRKYRKRARVGAPLKGSANTIRMLKAHHTLAAMLALVRGVSLSMEESITSREATIALRAVPHLFFSLVFTLVIFSWWRIIQQIEAMSKVAVHSAKLRPFLAANICYVILITGLFLAAAYAQVPELVLVGTIVSSMVCMCMAAAFCIFGRRLLAKLTGRSGKNLSAVSRKMTISTYSFSTLFSCESVLLLVALSIAYEVDAASLEARKPTLIAVRTLYYLLDACSILTVSFIFWRSVTKIVDEAKTIRSRAQPGSSQNWTQTSSSSTSGKHKRSTKNMVTVVVPKHATTAAAKKSKGPEAKRGKNLFLPND